MVQEPERLSQLDERGGQGEAGRVLHQLLHYPGVPVTKMGSEENEIVM